MIKKLKFIINITISSGFFIGFIKIIPATFGTFLAIPIIYLINDFNMFYKIIFVILLFIVGVLTSDYIEKYTNKKDPSFIVIDEIVGFIISFLNIQLNFINIFLGFIIFRILDIIKPFYIHKIQNIKGGLGIMLDDVAAGILTNIILLIIS